MHNKCIMRRDNRPSHTAAYGNIYIQRSYCDSCEGYAFILDGRLSCCNKPVEAGDFTKVKRISDCAIGRRGPSSLWRKKILSSQGDRCFYCYRWFGKLVYRKGKPQRLRCHWDHVSPYAYRLDNRDQNFVAACHVCNLLKSAKIFNDPDQARSYLYEAWERKGYSDQMPDVRFEIRPETPVAKVL